MSARIAEAGAGAPSGAGESCAGRTPAPDELEFRLLNEFQRDFPLVPRPYEEIARRLGVREEQAIAALARLLSRGLASRIGATFAPGRLGAATLAALAVAPERLEAVAAIVNAFPEVNHNYEREHRYNLWFVVTAPDDARVAAVVRAIESAAGCGRALSLPMIEAYRVDLGFDLRDGPGAPRRAASSGATGRRALAPAERALAAALQQGLALVPQPYAELGRRAGMAEEAAIATLCRWLEEGLVNRLGVIVRHRPLGFRANAMVVWDVPDARARAAGQALARAPGVTLCYLRERRPPDWPYNLYCMIHGRNRVEALSRIAALDALCGLAGYPYEVLFSRRCFRQCGARYVEEEAQAEHRGAAASSRTGGAR
jgi:DNA-binding Lrp family transcriptional regulator